MTDNTFILSMLNSKHKAHYEKSILGEILGGILDKNIDPRKISQKTDLNDLKKDITKVRALLQSEVSQQILIESIFGDHPHEVLTKYDFENTYTDGRDLQRGHPHLLDGVELNEQQSASLLNQGILNTFQIAVLQCFGNQNILSLLRTNALVSPHNCDQPNFISSALINTQKKTLTLRGALSLDFIYDHTNLQEQFYYCLYEDKTQSPSWIRLNLDEWDAITTKRSNDGNYSCQLLDTQQQWQPAILPNTFEFAQLVALSYEIVIHENRIEIKQFSRQAHSLIGAPDPVREALTLDFIGPREDDLTTFKSGMKPPVLTPIQTNHDRRNTNLRLLLIITTITLLSVINPISILGAKALTFAVASIAYWYIMVPGQHYKHPFDNIQAFSGSTAKITETPQPSQPNNTNINPLASDFFPMFTTPVKPTAAPASVAKMPCLNLTEDEASTPTGQPIHDGPR